MSDPAPMDAAPEGAFHHLLAEIQRTRAVLRATVDLRGSSDTSLLKPRLDSLRALEAFEAALAEKSLPVPRQIHADLEILRGLCGPTRNGRSR